MLAVNPDRLNQDQMLLEAPAFQGADPDSRAVVPPTATDCPRTISTTTAKS